MRFELHEEQARAPGLPVIKVIGLGGGGSNAVDYMAQQQVQGVEFICANTDAQALENLSVPVRIQLGASGLGAGARPEKGREAAMQDLDKIRQHLQGTDMLFITAGMGGGTGTGAAPVVAQAAREMGILTVGVVSRPFYFERRSEVAEEGIRQLREFVDSLIVIPNDKLIKVLGGNMKLTDGFNKANAVLHGAVQGVSELITRPGLINVDFEDVRTVMSCQGYALMGVGVASGEDRAVKAAEAAINNPLLEDVRVEDARGVLVNVTAGPDLTLSEWDDVGNLIESLADQSAEVIVGTSIDETLEGELRVTVVATGLESAGEAKMEMPSARRRRRQPEPQPQPAPVQPEQPVGPTVNVAQPEPAPEPVRSEPVRPEPIRPVPQPEPQVPPVNGPVNTTLGGTGTTGDPLPLEVGNYLDIPTFLRKQAN